MAQVKIPFGAISNNSDLALIAVNASPRAYGKDGKIIEGATGSPRIEIAIMNTLERFNVTCEKIDPAITAITAKEIEGSLQARNYYMVEFENAVATPYSARSGFGISYSVKADSVKLAPQTPSKPAARKAVE